MLLFPLSDDQRVIFIYFNVSCVILSQISSNHNVYLGQNIQHEFHEGQRVFVCGRLQPSSFRLGDDKLLTRLVIRANGVYVFDDLNNDKSSSPNEESSDDHDVENDVSTSDQNNVQILAYVASDVMNKDNHSTFALATHFTFK